MTKQKGQFTITCYNRIEVFDEEDRQKMADFYLMGMMACEGAESSRYASIYFDLVSGKKICTDGVKKDDLHSLR